MWSLTTDISENEMPLKTKSPQRTNTQSRTK